MENSNLKGHLFAVFTIVIWGTTAVSTKVLLRTLAPLEILLARFIFGFIALYIACPKKLKLTDKKQEITYALAGLTGITLYYLLENIALTLTSASNVSVIISTAPFFTALLTLKEEKQSKFFFIGFIVSMIGVCLISFNSTKLDLNPVGDFLIILAAIVWAFYSILSKKIGSYGYNMIQSTRHIFMYGLLFMIPAMLFMNVDFDLERILMGVNIINLLYLGLGASAMCFVTWNLAVQVLGPVRTTVYIYAQPAITVIFSILILHETITPMAIGGTVLTLMGLVISQRKTNKK